MADQDNTQQLKPVPAQAKSSTQGVFMWVITLAIVIGGGVGGFALAQLVAQAGPKTAQAPEHEEDFFSQVVEKGAKPWQYDLDAVIANLDEPGVTRFLRLTVTLEMSAQFDETKGRAFLQERTPLLTDFVSGYVSGLTLERVRGQNNRNRIKREIQAGFNDTLFPDAKPCVINVLFREFAVQ